MEGGWGLILPNSNIWLHHTGCGATVKYTKRYHLNTRSQK